MNKSLCTIAIVLVGLGCREDPEHGHGDEHNRGDKHSHGDQADHGDTDEQGGSVLSTLWSEHLEVFVEQQPAVAKRDTQFLFHLTRLDGFSAVDDDEVSIRLDLKNRHASKLAHHGLTRPGIVKARMSFNEAGTYRGTLKVVADGTESVFGDFTVEVSAAGKQPAAGAAKTHDEISFSKEQQWQVPFGTYEAAPGILVPSVELAGEVTTPPNGQADVGAAIAGRVMPPKGGLPQPGQQVKKGHLLASLAATPANPETSARARLNVVEAEGRVQSSTAHRLRAERLLSDRAIAEHQVLDARREEELAKKSLATAQKALSILDGAARGRGAGLYQITSPIDGEVVDVRASIGKSVTQGEELFRVVNLDELWLRARVPEQQASRLRADQDALFQIPGSATWTALRITGNSPSAKVVNIGRVVDPRSRTVDVIYSLGSASPELRVGAMVTVAVPAGESWLGVVVPIDSLLEDDGRSIVYVQTGGETFEERVVRVGPRAGDRVGIASGVATGEHVVSRGANILRLTSRAGTGSSHGHVH